MRRNVMMNETTEELMISKRGDKTWQKCKYLGTLLDTNEDLKRVKKTRKQCNVDKIRHIIRDR